MSTFDWRPITKYIAESATGLAIIEIQLHKSTVAFASVLNCVGTPPTEENVGDNIYFSLNANGEITKFILIEIL